jgi:hypothetical protein
MTEFSTPNQGNPPTRFSPAAGQIGQQAAMRGTKAGASGSQPSGSSRGSGLTSPKPRAPKGGEGSQKRTPPSEPETSDFRHTIVAAQYENMRRLGRDIAFGHYLLLNGHYRELMPNNARPFDLFLDTP